MQQRALKLALVMENNKKKIKKIKSPSMIQKHKMLGLLQATNVQLTQCTRYQALC